MHIYLQSLFTCSCLGEHIQVLITVVSHPVPGLIHSSLFNYKIRTWYVGEIVLSTVTVIIHIAEAFLRWHVTTSISDVRVALKPVQAAIDSTAFKLRSSKREHTVK